MPQVSDFDAFNPDALPPVQMPSQGASDFDVYNPAPYVQAPTDSFGGAGATGTWNGGPLTIDVLRPLFVAQESSGSYTAINSETGALGHYQIMPATGARLAQSIGLPWQPQLMRQNTPEGRQYQDALGTAEIQDAIDKGGGDPARIFSYYYSGNPNAYLNPRGNPRTARYVSDMMARLGGSAPAPYTPPPASGFQGPQAPAVHGSGFTGAQGPAVTGSGFTGAQSPAAQTQGGFLQTAKEYGSEALSGLESGVASAVRGVGSALDIINEAGPEQVAGAMYGGLGGYVFSPPMAPVKNSTVGREMVAPTAAAIQHEAEATAVKNPTLGERIVGGAAGMVPAMAAGAVNPLAMAGVFAQQSYDETLADAKAHGLSEVDAEKAARESAFISGGLGLVPGEQVVGRIGGAIADRLGVKAAQGAIGQAITRGITRAAGNAGVIGAMKAGSNVVARENYDPNRSPLAGVGEAALEGALGGELVHGAMHVGGRALDIGMTALDAARRPNEPVETGGVDTMPATDALQRYAGIPTVDVPSDTGAKVEPIIDPATGRPMPFGGVKTEPGDRFNPMTGEVIRDAEEPIMGAEEAARPASAMERPIAPAPEVVPEASMTAHEAAIPAIPVRPIGDESVAITPTGREVPVQYGVVDAKSLTASHDADGNINPAYPPELQPRDRARGISSLQIAQMAATLDPRLLMDSVKASDGAPIISPSGVVESGNGRTLAIMRAYAEHPEVAQAYQDALVARGYDVAGFDQPMLVRVRSADMAPSDVEAFTREANARDTLAYSATEQAQADARSLPPETMGLYRGGEIDAAANRDFVRSFLANAVPAAEHGAMVSADGTLSQQAIQRIRGAMLAKAYGDPDLIANIVEATDSNTKAIGGALTDVAASWAKMRDAASAGTIDPAMDITPNLVDAVKMIDRARREGMTVRDLVSQRDMFTGETVDPLTEGVLRLMFNKPDFTSPTGRGRLADALGKYVEQAELTSPGPDLFGETAKPTASDILALSKGVPDGSVPQADLLRSVPGAGEGAGGTGSDSEGRARAALPEAGGEEAANEGIPTAADVIAGRAEDVHRELTDRLAEVGLDRKVALKLVNSLDGPVGSFHNGIITIALDHPETMATLNHEVIHAVRDVFSDNEWNALTRRATANKALMASVARRYPDLDSEGQQEEAVADLFKRYARGDDQPKGLLATAFDRLRDVFRALGNGLRGRGFLTADSVMRAIDRGEIGGRVQDGRYTPSPLLQVTPDGTESEVHEAYLDQPKFAQPETEDEQRRAVGPVSRAIGNILGRGVDSVGAKLAGAADRFMPDTADELLHEVQLGVSPMGAGSQRAQASAKDFANAQRLAAYQWGKVDEWLAKTFDPDQRRKMWEAADEQGVLLRRGETPGIGQGFNRLNEKERAAVEELQRRAHQSFAAAKALGMVSGDGLESYVPRMIVEMTATGGKRIRAKATPEQARKGGNLSTTTGQLRQRKYETVEETEAAAQAAFGENTQVVRDIRTLGLATNRLDQAIAGRTLVDKIKAMSKDAEVPLVTENNTDPSNFFTLDHPALQKWGPKFVQNEETGKWEPVVNQNGDIQFEAKPLWISKEFEGPLNAVLSSPSTGVTRALMNLKAKMMSVIMYSPLMHNAVIWGKAIPADPKGVLSFMAYRAGNLARKDAATMTEAISAGMDPIGHRYFNQDIAGIATAEGQDLTPGRSWTAQLLGKIPGYFDKEAGLKTMAAIDKLGDFWHNTLLWDRIADLQAGLYVHARDGLIRDGFDPQTAQRYAAHFANRYAGALPMEGLSKAARTTANLALFSRSFTLGNIAAYKDIMAGLPSDVRSQIMRDAGPQALETVQGRARLKAMGMLVLDVGLAGVMLSVAGHFVSWLTGQQYQPSDKNEPGKEKRFLIGYQKDGTAIYGRLPTGKVAEDLIDWMGSPRETLLKKLSPYGRLMYSVAANDKGFGQKMFDENDNSISSIAHNIGAIAWSFVGGALPLAQFQAMDELATGRALDKKAAALQALAPLTGLTISHGAPGGPAMGDIYAVHERQQFLLNEARGEITDMIKQGDIAGARAKMTELGVSPGMQAYRIRVTQNPQLRMSPRQIRDFMFAATPEEKAQFQADAAAEAARRAAQ